MPRETLGKVVDATPRALLVAAREGLRIEHAGGGAAGEVAPRRGGVRIGAPVVDARMEPLGRVSDVIGPIDAPHVLVELPRARGGERRDRRGPGARGGPDLHRLLGKEVYVP